MNSQHMFSNHEIIHRFRPISFFNLFINFFRKREKGGREVEGRDRGREREGERHRNRETERNTDYVAPLNYVFFGCFLYVL